LEFEAAPGVCSCGADNTQGLWIFQTRARLRCVLCAPRKRRCAHCRKERPLEEFRVIRARLIMSCYCLGCERGKSLEQYRGGPTAKVRAIPRVKRCVACGAMKRREEFQRDNRRRRSTKG